MSSSPSSFNVFTFCLVDVFATTPAYLGRRPSLYAWMSSGDRARTLEAAATRLELAALVLALRTHLEGVSSVPLDVLTRRGVRNPELAEALRGFQAAKSLEGARVVAPGFRHWRELAQSVGKLTGQGTWVQCFEAAMGHMDAMRMEASQYREAAAREEQARQENSARAEASAFRRLRASLH